MTTLPLPSRSGVPQAGIGLRSPHLEEVTAVRPMTGFLEIHAENYMPRNSAQNTLLDLRDDYAFSVHAVGLSLGSADGVSEEHLASLAELVAELQPFLVSDHLSWSTVAGEYLNDLLPLPYTDEALDVVTANVDRVQTALGRPILIENPSAYLSFRDGDYSEPDFLAALCRRAGCRILLDLNNLYVGINNVGLDSVSYLNAISASMIGQYHLAGHAINVTDGMMVLIDDHGSRVHEDVWRLFADTVAKFGPRPTTVEWDTDLPPLPILLEEARTAGWIMQAATQERIHA